MSLTSNPAIERPHEALAYRPDIDGLRAIAVLAVIIFHARLGLFPGGFVGVDVFFVISGYLIASIILKEEEKDSFSLARFYERRIRRIFPALFVVILFCAGMGALLLTPTDYLAFGRSAFAAMAFWSNFYFTRQGGYFAPAAETQPLLHTWSLGVEEQFYLLAPFILLLLSRGLRRWRAPIFWSLFVASLGVSAWGVHTEARWAFFLPHSRAFELMCGVALAMGLVPRASSARANEALAALGLALIAVAVVFYSAATPFPGFAALVPAVGAALLIHSSTSLTQTAVARALSFAPVVYVGKISYSLYLWHWPLLAFAEYEFGHHLAGLASRAAAGRRLRAFGAELSLCGAARPPRGTAAHAQARLHRRRRRHRPDGGAEPDHREGPRPAGAVVAGGGGTGPRHADARDPRRPVRVPGRRTGPPHTRRMLRRRPVGAKSTLRPVGRFPRGDRLAGHRPLGHRGGRQGIQRRPRRLPAAAGARKGKLGLPPLPCGSARDRTHHRQPDVTEIVFIGRWGLYAEGVPSQNEAATRPRRFVERDDAANRAAFARVLRATVEKVRAAGKRVVIVGPVPEFDVNVPAAFIKGAMRGKRDDIVMARTDFDERQRGVLPVLAELSRMDGVRVVYPHEQLCDANVCRATAGGRALYVDDDHLSPDGARLLEPALRSALQDLRR